MHHTVGGPTVENECQIESDTIGNDPVQLKDVENAEGIFGKDISHLKGESAGKKPMMVTNNTTQVSDKIKNENTEIVPHVDIVHIDGMGFLTSIGHPMHHQKTTPVVDGAEDSCCTGSDKIPQIHNYNCSGCADVCRAQQWCRHTEPNDNQ